MGLVLALSASAVSPSRSLPQLKEKPVRTLQKADRNLGQLQFKASPMGKIQKKGRSVIKKNATVDDFVGIYEWIGADLLDGGSQYDNGTFTIEKNPNSGNSNFVRVIGFDPWLTSLDGYVQNGRLYIPNTFEMMYEELNQQVWFWNYTIQVEADAYGEVGYHIKKSKNEFYFTLDENGNIFAGEPLDNEKFENGEYTNAELEDMVCIASSGLPNYDPDGQGYFFGYWLCAWIQGAGFPTFIYNPSDWNYVGVGEFKDAWFYPAWYDVGDQPAWDVDIYQSKTSETQFLIMNPFGNGTPWENTNQSPIPGYIILDISDPNCVLLYPLVYTLELPLTLDSSEPQVDCKIYCYNDEGYKAIINGESTSDIALSYMMDRMPISTYDAKSRKATIYNGRFSISQAILEEYYYNEDTSGYIILPDLAAGNPETKSINVVYSSNGKQNQMELTPGQNGLYEVTLDNLDWFYFVDNFANTRFYVDLYESTIGMNLPAVSYLPTGNTYTFTPWRGSYKLVVSGDLSMITVTTTTSKPSTVDIYLLSQTTGNSFSNECKLTQTGNGTFSYTVPTDINGNWKIADNVWRYLYGYNGAVNPADTYQFQYNLENANIPLYKGDVVELSINTDKYYEPATVNIKRAEQEIPEPPVSDETKTVDINNIVYTLYPSEGYFVATDGTKASGDINLVASTEGLTLREVAPGAFKDNSSITSLFVPEGVTTIGNEAFRGCYRLFDVSLPSTVTTIGKYAFLDCTYINSFTLPSKISSLGVGAFQGCSDLETFNFNRAALKEIPDALFEGCSRLQEVEIPASVTSIGSNAFLSSGVVKIGNTTNVTAIGDRSFENCPISQFDFNNIQSIGSGAFSGTTLKSAEMTSTLKTLGGEAFRNCKNLANVTLPSGLKTIEKSTFEGCTALASIEIPSSVTAILDRAFYNSGLVTVEVGNNVKELGANALVNQTLTSISLGSGITNLENMPVWTTGLLRVNNPNPPALGSDRLGCEPTVVIVPRGSSDAYLQNTRWKQYNILEEDDEVIIYLSAPGALTSDLRMKQKLAPKVTSLTIITDPTHGTLDENDWNAIRSNMTALIKLNIADADVENIYDNCFKDKRILTEIVLPKNLKTIGRGAFENCALLKGVNLTSNLTSIGERAFAGCNSLDGTVTIPAACAEVGARAFLNCYALDAVIINSGSLTGIENNTFENCRDLDSVILPKGIKTIGERAFAETGITSISLPSSLTSIEQSAFEGCFYLSSVNLPNGLSSIGNRAFAKSGLVSVTLPESITAVEDETFDKCDDLLFVNLPSGLKTIGSRAFASPSISGVSSPAPNPPTGIYNPFDGVNNYTCTLSIPAFSYNDYVTAQYWGAFVGIHDNINVMIEGKEDITYIDEEDYQALLRNASGKGVKGKLAKKAVNAIALDGSNFTRLFNGAQMFVPENVITRIFFGGNIDDYTIEYNGTNVSSQVDRNTKSWVTPPMQGSSLIRIVNKNDAVESIFAPEINSSNVYDTMGRLLLKDATQDQINALAPGIYIVGGRKVMVGNNR